MPEIMKKDLIYISIAILFLVHMKVNFPAILDFFFQIYSSATFIPNPTMLPQISPFIVNMFSSILIVTVNISKTADVLDLKAK